MDTDDPIACKHEAQFIIARMEDDSVALWNLLWAAGGRDYSFAGKDQVENIQRELADLDGPE